MNGTRLIIKDRGKGKTTQLLYTSATTGYPIIVRSESSIRFLKEKAEGLDLIIPEPMTFDQFRFFNCGISNILIDEGYDLIGEALDEYMGSHVVVVTLTDRIKERVSLRNVF